MNNINVIPVVSYNNVEDNKSLIYEANRNKSGIYRWNNIVTGASYVGSAKNLASRLSNYLSKRFLYRELTRNNSIISSSLLKYGYSNFSLDILEYCELDVLILKKQYYIDTLKCEYNILKTAGSRLGCKHSPETLLKFKDRKLSSSALANLKLSKAGVAPTSPLRKINHLLATGHITTVVNVETNSVKVYGSIRAAARDIGTSHVTVLNYINSYKLLHNLYLITTRK